jgi:hypothetical protein
MTIVQELKAPIPHGAETCAKCQGQLDADRYCARCIELPCCCECAVPSYDGDMMCDTCAERYGLRTVRQMIEWRVLIGQLDKAAGAAVLEIIEMAEERLP